MPRVPIDEAHRTGEGGDKFPTLDLKKGEKARGLILEDPYTEWTHFFRAIRLMNGVPQREVKHRKDGSTYEDWETEFLGQAFCLGDPGVLAGQLFDPDNCPACALATQDASLKPQRRYAVNYLRYRLQAGTWNLQVPLSAEIRVLKFTGKMYDVLEDKQRLHGPLNRLDVTLVCEDETFKRFAIDIDPTQGWKQFGKEGAAFIKALWNGEGNRATDAQLRQHCGWDASRSDMAADAQRVLDAARRASNAPSASLADPTEGSALGNGSGQQDLAAGVDSLLNDPDDDLDLSKHPGGMEEFGGTTTPAANGAAAPEMNLDDDPLAGAVNQVADPLAGAAPEAPAAPAGAAKSFDDLMEDLSS
jgi:hypothetical protein